jgi:hypothetical protein
MRLSYDLSEFSEEICENLSLRLRDLLIPHLLDNNSLLIDKSDESTVELILSEFGSVDSLQDQLNPPWNSARTTQDIIDDYLEQTSSGNSPIDTTSYESGEEAGAIAMFGLLIGGGFGVLIVIGAFTDPNFEGRVYIFLPAIIFGVLGFGIGLGIEKAIKQVRK